MFISFHFWVIWESGKFGLKKGTGVAPPPPAPYRQCPLFLPFFLQESVPKLSLFFFCSSSGLRRWIGSWSEVFCISSGFVFHGLIADDIELQMQTIPPPRQSCNRFWLQQVWERSRAISLVGFSGIYIEFNQSNVWLSDRFIILCNTHRKISV